MILQTEKYNTGGKELWATITGNDETGFVCRVIWGDKAVIDTSSVFNIDALVLMSWIASDMSRVSVPMGISRETYLRMCDDLMARLPIVLMHRGRYEHLRYEQTDVVL